ncbi:MAG: cytidine deaminase [Edaphobacter sp.]|uniref:cytidine deaminase n=1 Tax=Edaphobacter sp. TaxID=1934404 RepID=UPI002382FCF5|nr:cytidine deaminase [Edaphobacter sp.]MDE1174990.1 cytidine deaminase [Edaphobacter sp.]
MSQNESAGTVSNSQFEQLRELALAVAAKAYAPYSGFRVGAAVLLEDGRTSQGCNVENASYRLTTCAEQAAISSAVALYGPAIRIRTVVIVNLNQSACQPCGACRQTIQEFSSHDTLVCFPAEDGQMTQSTIAALLPHAFVLAE